MIFINGKIRKELTIVESYINGINVDKVLKGFKNGFIFSTETQYYYLILNGIIHSANNTTEPKKSILTNWKYYLHGKFLVRQNTTFNLDTTKFVFIKNI
jgi:hypothetical protein